MNKLLSIVLSMLLVFGLFGTIAIAEEPPESPERASSKETQVLTALGLLSLENDEETAMLTRAQVAVTMTRLLGLTDKLGEQGSRFADVPADHPAAGEINLLAGMGVVSGDGANFYPDSNVTCQELAKMLVQALGYGVTADQRGGYPTGYLVVANQLDLLKGAPAGGEALSVRQAAKMIYQAAKVDLMVQTGFGTAQESYESYDGRTLLTENMKIGVGKGVLLATHKTTLLLGNPPREGYVAINDQTYACQIDNVDRYLGYRVEYYYSLVDGEESAIRCMVSLDQNQSEEMDLGDVDSIVRNNDLSLRITYEQKDGTKRLEADVPAAAAFLYNGRSAEADDALLEELKSRSGSIRLIDNNGDGEYDVCFISAFEVAVIESILADQSKIYDKISGGVIDLDASGSDRSVSITLDGEGVALSELFPGDLLQIYESLDHKVVDVVVSLDNFDGALQEKSGDEEELVIDGKAYQTEPGYRVLGKRAQLGDSGTFYLSTNGRVAYFSKDEYSTSLQYGFLINMKQDSGLATVFELKLMDSRGDIQLFTSRDRVTLNKKSMDAPAAYQKLLTTGPDGMPMAARQLVRYRLDQEGNLAELITASKDEPSSDAKKNQDFSLNMENPTALYRMGNYFNSLYQITAETQIYVVPADDDGAGNAFSCDILTDETNYSVQPMSYLSHDDGKNEYHIKIYDSDEMYSAKALVIYTRKIGTGAKADLMGDAGLAIERISRAVDENGDEKIRVSGVSGGKKVDYFLYDDNLMDQNEVDLLQPKDESNIYDDFPERQTDVNGDPVYDSDFGKNLPAKRMADLRCGDVISFQTNPKGEINSFMLLYHENPNGQKPFEKANTGVPGSDIYSNMYIAYGVVERKGSGKFLMRVDVTDASGAVTSYTRAIPAGGSISKCNRAKGTLQPAAGADIVRGAKVFVRTVYGSNEAKDIVIYE